MAAGAVKVVRLSTKKACLYADSPQRGCDAVRGDVHVWMVDQQQMLIHPNIFDFFLNLKGLAVNKMRTYNSFKTMAFASDFDLPSC